MTHAKTQRTTPSDDALGALTVERRVHFTPGRRGRRKLRDGPVAPPVDAPTGRVPRVSRLVALAHRFEHLIATGAVHDQAELARIAGVTRARVTQIMNLLCLAPDIQEAVLHLPAVTRGRDPVTERSVRAIAALPEWRRQRRAWRSVSARVGGPVGTVGTPE